MVYEKIYEDVTSLYNEGRRKKIKTKQAWEIVKSLGHGLPIPGLAAACRVSEDAVREIKTIYDNLTSQEKLSGDCTKKD